MFKGVVNAKSFFKFFVILSALLVTACNFESDSNQGASSLPDNNTGHFVTAYAKDSYDFVQQKSDNQVHINLTDKVQLSSDTEVVISQLDILSNDSSCRVLSQDESGFVLAADDTKICDYEFSISAKGTDSTELTGKTSAISRVVVSEDPDGSALLPFGVVAYQDETSDINIADELTKVGDFTDLSGYTLDTVYASNNSSAEIEQDKENNIIKYTPAADFLGNEQLLYSLKNDEGNVLAGSIIVTVAAKSNSGIDIQDKIIIDEGVNILSPITIDLTPYVQNSYGDDWQLVYVSTFDAQVSLTDATDVQNKSFVFMAETAGDYYVNAAVTDHHGGYDVALIRIIAHDPNAQGDWADIIQGLMVYKAPLTLSEAQSEGVTVSGSNYDSVDATVAQFNFTDASSYCGSVGRLPTADELTALFTISKPGQLGWPIDVPYYSDDVNTIVDLSTGVSSGVSGAQSYYVTCVAEGELSILLNESTITSVIADGVETAKVMAQLTYNGEPVEGEMLTAQVASDSQAQIDQATIATDAEGKAEFLFTDIKAENVDTTISYNDVERVTNVQFVGDPDTAILALDVVIDNQTVAGGTDQVVASLKDYYDNVVAGQDVTFTTDDVYASLDNAIVSTDTAGEALNNIVYTDETAQTSKNVTVTSRYRDQVQTADITFLVGEITDFTQLGIDADGKATIQATVNTVDSDPVVGVDVQFTVQSGDCSLVNTTATTDSSGKAVNSVVQGDDTECMVEASFGDSTSLLEVSWSPYVQVILDEPVDYYGVIAGCENAGYETIGNSKYSFDPVFDWFAEHPIPSSWKLTVMNDSCTNDNFNTFGLTGVNIAESTGWGCHAGDVSTSAFASDMLSYDITNLEVKSKYIVCKIKTE